MQDLLPPLLTNSSPSDDPAVIEIADQKKDLDRIDVYALTKAKLPLRLRDKLIYGTIAVATLASPVSYLRPAYEDKPFGLPDTAPFKWNQVAGTWIPTAYIFYSADIDFLQIRAANIIPDKFIDILEGPTKAERRRQDVGIFTISTLSAIPLTTPLVKYPLITTGEPKYDIIGNVVLITVILVANSLAHLRPLQVIVTDPWYGAPITLIRAAVKKWHERNLSQEEKSALRGVERAKVETAQSKAHYTSMLRAQKELLIDSCFVRKPGLGGYTLQLSEDFVRISALTGEAFIHGLMQYRRTPASESNSPNTCQRKAYEAFLDSTGQMGGTMVLAESVGYLSNAGFTLANMTGNTAAGWLLAAVPMWAFGVLMHMIGVSSFRSNIDFMIGFAQGKNSLSWPIKYCSKIYFGICFLPNLWLSYMTPGSGNTMIRGDLTDYWGEDNTETYISVTRWAFVALIAFLMPAAEAYLFKLWAKYGGTSEARQIVELDERVEGNIVLSLKWKDSRFLDQAPQQAPLSPPPSTAINSSPPSSPEKGKGPRRSWCEWFCPGRPRTQSGPIPSNSRRSRELGVVA